MKDLQEAQDAHVGVKLLLACLLGMEKNAQRRRLCLLADAGRSSEDGCRRSQDGRRQGDRTVLEETKVRKKKDSLD